MRALVALLSTVLLAVTSACAQSGDTAAHPSSVQSAAIGESLAVLGWNFAPSNLRFDGDYVLVDGDASPSQSSVPHANPEDIRVGLYGALAHPLEANAIGGCRDVTRLAGQPAAALTPDRLTGTVCLGPMRDQSQVRGIYIYTPRDRIPDTTAAYAAAFPVGVLPTNQNDTGLTIRTTSVDAFRADGAELHPSALGDQQAFTGKGYLLLGLEISGLATRYREDSARPGGPVRASLCTQGEINAALLYASVSLVGIHAGLWTSDE